MNVDDESTLADLKRYDLLVFGGWNTMMPLQRTCCGATSKTAACS